VSFALESDAVGIDDGPPVRLVDRGYQVRGRVQGVGYRWWTYRAAAGLGLVGSVRNLSDGSVQVLARGTPEVLGELESLLQSGPPLARVDRIASVEAVLDTGVTTFVVEG
jgi:acylphosphatase